MKGRTTGGEAALDDIGLDLDSVAGSAMRVFALVTGEEPTEEPGEGCAGWLAVARHAAATFGEGDDEITLTFPQLGSMFRRAFARAEDPDAELPEFADLPRVVQVAWQAVARHMANVFAFDEKDVGHLRRHEQTIADWAKTRLAAPPA